MAPGCRFHLRRRQAGPGRHRGRTAVEHKAVTCGKRRCKGRKGQVSLRRRQVNAVVPSAGRDEHGCHRGDGRRGSHCADPAPTWSRNPRDRRTRMSGARAPAASPPAGLRRREPRSAADAPGPGISASVIPFARLQPARRSSGSPGRRSWPWPHSPRFPTATQRRQLHEHQDTGPTRSPGWGSGRSRIPPRRQAFLWASSTAR
jgi:hypothetical protein